ncbi:uncharacterized protein FIESC28_07698 [Fusarium coffeatum]|uniref:Amino acid permease/ SLC12A domain-containing protein n=1 Tax=Fusarium coffeatum TaxID=231269 RepID=A0A366RC86_9HYPO|nr:uncharacterized protein FIESC28_07698 [Fusarium coffeatum]RBR14462.1 hypothetical protein FIESC28_07698 [Fusarium coffeatum]
MDSTKHDGGHGVAVSPRRSMDIPAPKAEMNADELRLAQMGHTQELNRHFSTLSLIGLASTTTISWTGLGLGLITEIGAGGPGAVIYGFILVTILQCFLGASLAEFVSSYPTEGGMYHWIAAVAPRRTTGILSFLTGWFSVLGWIFTTASTNIIYAQILMALIALYMPDLEIKAWQTFIVYEGLNLLTAGVVMFGNKIIPALNRFSLFYLQIGWLVVLITVVACAPTHRDPEFVFRTWINTTGWENNAICFITGLVNPLYSLGGLDGVTHITEEMPNPSRNAPLAIAITLIIAFCTGITYLISLMFSIQDFDQLTSGNTGMPLAELFRQVTQKTGGAFGLLFILFIALGPCVISSQLSTGRVFWAFSRDGAMPFSKVWSKVHFSLKMPFNAQLAVTAIIAALGCLYLGSSTAFNSLLGTAVTINNISYMFPILTNLITGRKNMHKGVFHMGPTIGPIVNVVTVCWLTFAIIFFSFPYVMPVEAANMNYTCVVVGGLAILIGGWWFKAGKDDAIELQSKRLPPSTEKGSVWEPLVESESGHDISRRSSVRPLEPSYVETPENKSLSIKKACRRFLLLIPRIPPLIRHLALVHFPPVAITLAVLSLYIANLRWSNPTNNALNALQFAAKIHEALIIVSIGDILLGRINHHLLNKGDSLPLGYLPSPLLLNSPFLYLISPELWAPILSSRGQHRTRKATGVMILLSALLCIAASPLSAITMIPRQGWRPAQYLTASELKTTYTPGTLYNTDLDAGDVPVHNYTRYSAWFTTPSQKSILETTITNERSEDPTPFTNVTYSNYQATGRPMSYKTLGITAVATCPLSTVARYLGDRKYRRGWEIPIAQHPWLLKLNETKNMSNSGGPLGHSFINIRDANQLPVSTDIMFASIMNETTDEYYGYTIPQRPTVVSFTLCLISARWTEADVWAEDDRSRDALSHFSFANGQEVNEVRNSFGTRSFISMNEGWMAGIGSVPTISANRSSYDEALDFCITRRRNTIGLIPKGRSGYEPLSPDHACIETFLAMHVADALAELGGFQEAISNKPWNRSFSLDGNSVVYTSYENVYSYQFGSSIGIPIAFSVLLFHVLVVLIYIPLLFFSEHLRNRPGWSNLGDLLVLTLSSDVDVDLTKGKASEKWTRPVVVRDLGHTGRKDIVVRDNGDDMD